MTAPGTFSNAQGATGQYHLVLKGANGEPVVTSENHPTRAGSKESLEVIVRTVLDAAYTNLPHDWTLASLGGGEEDGVVDRITNHLWAAGQ